MSKDRYSLALRLVDEFWEYCTELGVNPTFKRFEDWLLNNKEALNATQTISRTQKEDSNSRV